MHPQSVLLLLLPLHENALKAEDMGHHKNGNVRRRHGRCGNERI